MTRILAKAAVGIAAVIGAIVMQAPAANAAPIRTGATPPSVTTCTDSRTDTSASVKCTWNQSGPVPYKYRAKITCIGVSGYYYGSYVFYGSSSTAQCPTGRILNVDYVEFEQL